MTKEYILRDTPVKIGDKLIYTDKDLVLALDWNYRKMRVVDD